VIYLVTSVARQTVVLASYDERMLAGARALQIPLYEF
jgi:hypothetical protein